MWLSTKEKYSRQEESHFKLEMKDEFFLPISTSAWISSSSSKSPHRERWRIECGSESARESIQHPKFGGINANTDFDWNIFLWIGSWNEIRIREKKCSIRLWWNWLYFAWMRFYQQLIIVVVTLVVWDVVWYQNKLTSCGSWDFGA